MNVHFAQLLVLTVGIGWLMSRLGFGASMLEQRRRPPRSRCPSCGRLLGADGCRHCR